MTKTQIRAAQNHELIAEGMVTCCILQAKWSQGIGTKGIEKEFRNICEELTKRDLLTAEEVEYILR